VGTIRPYSHSLLTVAAIALLAWWLRGVRRAAALAIAVAVLSHLMRDMATGGVALLWPLSWGNMTVAYDFYAATLVICGMVVIHGARSASRAPA